MILNAKQITELKEMVNTSLRSLYTNDFQLIERAVNERAVVFRFGTYLNELLRDSTFQGYNLDCEYNRNLGDAKRTENFPNGVIPDVLIHSRNLNTNNALVIEFKGHWNKLDREPDHKKIIDFTNQNSTDNYKYGLGAVIELDKNKPDIQYYIDYVPE